MFLGGAYNIYSNLPVTEKVTFSTFCELRPKNVLLLNQSPVHQYKCTINKLKVQRLHVSCTFWNFVLCDDPLNSVCWQGNCEDCTDSKKLNLNIDPAANVSWSQRCYMEHNENHQKKIQSITYTCAGQFIECIRNDWNKVLTHVNIKRIQNLRFQEDLQKPEAHVLQIDFELFLWIPE